MTPLLYVRLFCVAFVLTSSVKGARESTVSLPDICSSDNEDDQYETLKAYLRRLRDPSEHISDRQSRYFMFGGIVQAIAEKTQIPRDEVVKGGASKYQDHHSGRGTEIHAAHIIRVGQIDPRLETKDEPLYRSLKNYIGHTQNVEKKANVWHGVGGKIDKLQSEKLNVLATIDFTANLNANQRPVERLIADFRDAVAPFARVGTMDDDTEKFLNPDKVILNCLPVKMFEMGRRGYDIVQRGIFVEYYKDFVEENRALLS